MLQNTYTVFQINSVILNLLFFNVSLFPQNIKQHNHFQLW